MENFNAEEKVVAAELKLVDANTQNTIESIDNAEADTVSLLDESNIKEDKRVQFSDEELQEFKELIVDKINKANADFELLKGTLALRGDNGTNDTSPTFKQLEDAVDVLSKEETAQHAMRQEKFITHLKNALIRIENKSYGICRITGKLIAKERLRSVPHATTCIDAKRNFSDLNI